MTTAINNFVKEWSQHFNLQNINIEAIKLSKEKHNLLPRNQPSSLHHWLLECRLGFTHQPCCLGTGGRFHLPQRTISEAAAPPSRAGTASSTTGSSVASSLSSSHSSNIITLWWTAAVLQHCQYTRKQVNKKIVRILNISLTVRDTLPKIGYCHIFCYFKTDNVLI